MNLAIDNIPPPPKLWTLTEFFTLLHNYVCDHKGHYPYALFASAQQVNLWMNELSPLSVGPKPLHPTIR